MSRPRCIVTGGAGFIGSHIADLLIDRGADVIVLDSMATGRRENINRKADFRRCDIRNAAALGRHFKKVDWVFHLAALPRIQPSFDEPIEHEQVNVLGTINCVQAALAGGVKRFIYSASSSCYGNATELPTSEGAAIDPLNPYALQKYAAERYVLLLGQRFGLPSLALRYFNAYGPRSFNPGNPQNAYSSVLGIFAHQKKMGVPLSITGDGRQSRDFVHVKDIALANLKAAESKICWDVFNIGAGRPYKVIDIAKMLKHPYKFIPARLGEADVTHAKISKARKMLKWAPSIDLKTGLKDLT